MKRRLMNLLEEQKQAWVAHTPATERWALTLKREVAAPAAAPRPLPVDIKPRQGPRQRNATLGLMGDETTKLGCAEKKGGSAPPGTDRAAGEQRLQEEMHPKPDLNLNLDLNLTLGDQDLNSDLNHSFRKLDLNQDLNAGSPFSVFFMVFFISVRCGFFCFFLYGGFLRI